MLKFLFYNFRYNKTEDLSPGGADMMRYTHLLMGNSSNLHYYKQSHLVDGTIDGFDGVSLDEHKFPFLQFRTSPKIWIMAKR